MFLRSLPNVFVKAQPKKALLTGYPPYLYECFEFLKSAGAENFALFGGAIRDADYSARHHQPHAIKDYDIRVWLPAKEYVQCQEIFIKKLSATACVPMRAVPCPGTNKVHYIIMFRGIELDISIRPVPLTFQNTPIPVEAVAIDRARDSDVGLCSVAIDPLGQAWVMPEYLIDQMYQTITVYPSNDLDRVDAYVKRMQIKFPKHCVVQEAPTQSSQTHRMEN